MHILLQRGGLLGAHVLLLPLPVSLLNIPPRQNTPWCFEGSEMLTTSEQRCWLLQLCAVYTTQ